MKRVVLVTGASRGIGLATVRLFQERQVDVILASRVLEKAESAAKRIGCAAVQLDITDQASVDQAANWIGERFGRLDVLVNNSGILLDHYESLRDLKLETLRETLETNLIGTLRVTQALLPLLQASSDPRIINVASGAGQLDGEPQAWAPAYSISKTALNMLTQQLTAALPEIMTNSMCPGWCRTDMGGAGATRTPAEGADTILWLALDAPSTLRGRFVKDRKVIPW